MGDNYIILVDSMYNVRKIYGDFEEIIDSNITNLRNIKDNNLYSIIDLGIKSIISSNDQKISFQNILVGKDSAKIPVNIIFEKILREDIFSIEIRGLELLKTNRFYDDSKISNVFKIAVEELKKSNEKLRYLAYYDHLTNLPNRIYMYEKLTELINENEEKVGVFVLDIDRFKTINDTLGHKTGDEIIKEIARRLKGVISNKGIVGRVGGDEFAIIMPDIEDTKKIEDLCELIRFELKKMFEFKGLRFSMNVSIGTAIYPDDALDYENLIKNADIAMYRVKAKGGNGYECYDKNLKESFALKMEIESKMKNAIKNKEMELFYQPQMDLESMKIKSCEALIRWNNKDLGKISPEKFIPIAEETGLIKNIGNWVINEVFRQSKKWSEKGYDISISLNVSPIQFHKQDMYSLIKKNMEFYGVDGRCICLEITEGISFLNEEYALNILQKLKSLGVKIAIDDFGVGYSSLSYMRKFPIDEIKIDKIFIKDIQTNENDKSIVETTLYLAQRLNIMTVVEGVETKEQYQIIKSMKADKIQGYYFSKPLSEEDFEEYLKTFQNIGIKC